MIYQGFFSFQERAQLEQIKTLPPTDMPWQADDFKDPRAAELIRRFRARNFPESLDSEQQITWAQSCQERLQQRHGEDWEHWFEHLDRLRAEVSSTSDQDLLDQIEAYAFSLQ